MALRFFEIEMGAYSLTVATMADDDDMDCCFVVVDMDQGDVIQLNGWLVEEQEEVDPISTPQGDSAIAALGWLEMA